MKNILEHNAVHNIAIEDARNRTIRQITTILANRLRVHEGAQLVGIIGRGDEKSNYEAITTWVSVHLDETMARSAQAAADILYRPLVGLLLESESA